MSSEHSRHYTGRGPLIFSADIGCYRCRPATAMDSGYDFYRNGQSDDVVFIWAGGGWLESQYGRLRYQPDDYVVIPRGTIYRFVPDDITQEDYLTGELAVMFDTQFPLELTQQALALDDPDYPLSWLG